MMADRKRKKSAKHNLNIIGAPCLVSVAYWRRGTSVRQHIGALMHPAPIVLAHPCANTITNGAPKKKCLDRNGYISQTVIARP
jgi:hypothetical protein